MNYFVFRNNTVERFFGKEYRFSGYDDISSIPNDVDGFVWWYQIPVKYNQQILAEEIIGYSEKLSYVSQRVKKPMILLTMDVLYNVPFTDDDHRVTLAINNYNSILYKIEKENNNIKVIDIREFYNRYAADELFDWKFYFMSQMGLNPKLSKSFKAWFERKIGSIALKRKKCLVLDLDNTLWGGVLGEDGIDGIQIGGDYPGKAFSYWQDALLYLSKSGVILTVCSKNNEQDVLDAWEKNPFIVLRKDVFSAYRINWADKATNIKAIAEELNIGLDSLVFIDDNPTERELIRHALPMVSVPEFPEQPYMLPAFFKQLVDDYFRVYSVTDEDRRKTQQYKANANRVRSQKTFANFDLFLESLNIQITIESANEFNIQRIAQMTQKTNQFNLTTKRYTDVDIRRFIECGWNIWCISVADKFGDNGITGTIMLNGTEIDTFLLSCRILGKGIEFAFVKKILSLLFDYGMTRLTATYLPTEKNMQVEDFYEKCGFTLIQVNEDKSKEYEIDLTKADYSIKKWYQIIIK